MTKAQRRRWIVKAMEHALLVLFLWGGIWLVSIFIHGALSLLGVA